MFCLSSDLLTKKIYTHLSYLISKQLQPIIYYSRLLGFLAPVTDVILTYAQEPLEIGRRGSMGRRLNGKKR
jgi:hypothetical protein